MSQQPYTYSLNKWKAATGAVLVLLVIFVGVAAYMTVKLESANNDNASLKKQVTSLNGQISTLNSQVSALQGQVTTLQGQLNADQTLIAQLNAQIAALKASHIVFIWFETHSNPICIPGFFCITGGRGTITDVAWANLGTNAATQVQIVATWYGASGRLCSVTEQLGTKGSVSGQDIGGFVDQTGFSCAWDASLGNESSASAVVTWS